MLLQIMHDHRFFKYDPLMREYARELRNNSTQAEIILWKKIKNRALGVQFHRQVPMFCYIVDFYCYDLFLAIEIDGNSHDYKDDYDTIRQGFLEDKGVHFIRFTDADVKNDVDKVIALLKEEIEKLLGE